MEASILDLRYKMNDVLKALDRNETVKIFYRGKLKGELQPANTTIHKKPLKVADQPFFGMHKTADESVEDTMKKLRKGRFDDVV